jgi:hypothetical protein
VSARFVVTSSVIYLQLQGLSMDSTRDANRKKRGATIINLTLLRRRKQIVGANGAEPEQLDFLQSHRSDSSALESTKAVCALVYIYMSLCN